MKTSKRFISLALVFALVFSMVVTCAAAEDSETTEEVEQVIDSESEGNTAEAAETGENLSGKVLLDTYGTSEKNAEEDPTENADEIMTEIQQDQEDMLADIPEVQEPEGSILPLDETDTDSDEVYVGSYEDLINVFSRATYSSEITVYLTDDIQVQSRITTLFSAANYHYKNVTIDGQNQYTLKGPASGNYIRIFDFSTGSYENLSLTLQNIKLDGNGGQIMNWSSTNRYKKTITFENVDIVNCYSNTGGRAMICNSTNDVDLTLKEVRMSDGVGTMIYTTNGANVVIDNCELTTNVSDSTYGVFYQSASATTPSSWTITNNSKITMKLDEGETAVIPGMYMASYTTTTVDGGSVITGPDDSQYCFNVYGTTNDLILNDCTIQNTDGSSAVIRAGYQSALIETDGRVQGEPLVSLRVGYGMQINDELQYPIRFAFESSINGSDPLVATGGNGHQLNSVDLSMLSYYTDSVRQLTLSGNSAYFMRVSNAEIEVNNADSFKSAVETIDCDTLTILLTADLTLDNDSRATSIGPSTVVIDGQNQHKITMSSGMERIFWLDSAGMANKSLTFKDLTLDANGQRLLIVLGYNSNFGLIFDGCTVENLQGNGSYGAIYVYGDAPGEGIVIRNSTLTGTGPLLSLTRENATITDGSVIKTKPEINVLDYQNAAVYMDAGTNAYNTSLTVDGGSQIIMEDSESKCGFGIYLYGSYANLTVQGDSEISGTNLNGESEAIHIFNANDNVYLGNCTIRNSDGTQALVGLGTTSDTSGLFIQGNVQGNPQIILANGAYIRLTCELENPLTFSYESSIAASDPYVAYGDGYSLSDADLKNLVYADTESARTLVMVGRYVILQRSEDTVYVDVDSAETLKEALENEHYADYAQLFIRLTDEIEIDTANRITNVLSDNVVIDGTGEKNNFTIRAKDLSNSMFSFTIGNSSVEKQFTLQNLTLDADGGRAFALIGTSSHPGDLLLSNVALANVECTSYNASSAGISVGAANCTFDHVSTKNCTGTLLYSTSGNLTILNSTLSAKADESMTQATYMIYVNSGNSDRTLEITNSEISWSDDLGLMGGIYLGSSSSSEPRDVIISDGTCLVSDSYHSDAIYVESSYSHVQLNDCTLKTADGESTYVRLNDADCVIETNGLTQGGPVILLQNGAMIQINDDLQYDLQYDFFNNPGEMSVVVACAGGDHAGLTGADLERLVYLDSGSPRMLNIHADDGYAWLEPVNIDNCEVSLEDIALDTEGNPVRSTEGHYIIYGTWTAGEIKPDAIIVNENGVRADSSNYTMEYEGDTTVPEGAAPGYTQTVTVTVTPQNGLTGNSVQLIYDIVVPETEDLSDSEKTTILLTYDDETGTYEVRVQYEQGILTEGQDYTLAYDLDPDRYELTITVTGAGYYVGSQSKTVRLPGWETVLAYVFDEDSLNAALDAGLERIYFTDDIQVQEIEPITSSVTIDGQGHTLSASGFSTPGGSSTVSYRTVALLSVQDEVELTVIDLTVNGNNVAHCLYVGDGASAELNGETVLRNGGHTSEGYDGGSLIYVDQGGTVTLYDCEVRDNVTNNSNSNVTRYGVGIIRNRGVLNVEQGAYLTNLQTKEQGIVNEGTINWNGGTFDINGDSNSYSSYSSSYSVGSVIYNAEDATFNLTAGEINGFLLNDQDEREHTGEFTVSYHGAIDNYGSVNMSGGLITGVDADGTANANTSYVPAGGAVYNSGTFNMTGGTIANNCSDLGGGVFNVGVFNMSGGTISDNGLTGDTITKHNYGIGQPGGSADGVIFVSNIGANLCLASNSKATISGGTIEGNTISRIEPEDGDGNIETREFSVGITLYAGFSVQTVSGDVELTISGSPEINSDILLFNTIGTNEFTSWLVPDDMENVSLKVSTLNNTDGGFTSNMTGDIIAAYDGVPTSASDSSKMTVGKGSYIYLTHETFTRTYSDPYDDGRGPNSGSGNGGIPSAPKSYDFDAWVVCNHEEMTMLDELPAKCEEDGRIACYYCEYCGGYFSLDDPQGKTALTEDQYRIPALGHEWTIVPEVPATASENGQTSYIACERCGAMLTEPETIPAGTGSKSALESVVDTVETLDEGDYTAESWANLQVALAAAQNVLSNDKSTSEEAEDALAALSIAIANLQTTSSTPQPAAFTGFKNEDGVWQYYVNDVKSSLNSVISGTVNGTEGMWYVLNGIAQIDFTGLCNYADANGNWWYVTKGMVDTGHNGVDQNDYGWWYVTGGKVQFGYTGVANYANAYGWWYINGGQVDFGKTGIEPNDYGWWRVVGGQVDFGCNSVEQNDYGWWYLVGGQVQFGYTGVADYANDYGWWYIRDGKVDFGCNSVEQNSYGWWYVVGGQVQFGYTGVANYANDYGWWYIRDGKVDFSYTGTASNSYGNWYVVNGKVDFTRSAG